jgi:hypothetical protein
MRAFTLLCLALLCLADPAAAQPAPSDRADQLLAEAMELGREKKWPEARAKLDEAAKLKPAYDIVGNLGLVEAEMADHAAAAEHIDYALRFWPANGKPEKKKHLETVLAGELAHVAAITLRVSADGARVRLGDRDLGPSPIPHRVFAAPGTVRLRVERDGYEPWEKDLGAEAGKALPVDVKLIKTGGEGGAGGGGGAGGQGGDGGEPEPRPIWPTITLGVLTGLSAIATGAFVGVHVAKKGEADDAAEQARAQGVTCGADGQGPAICQTYADANSDQSLFGNLAIAGGVLTGVALAGLLTYALWPEPEPGGGGSATRFVPMPGAHGILMQHSF